MIHPLARDEAEALEEDADLKVEDRTGWGEGKERCRVTLSVELMVKLFAMRGDVQVTSAQISDNRLEQDNGTAFASRGAAVAQGKKPGVSVWRQPRAHPQLVVPEIRLGIHMSNRPRISSCKAAAGSAVGNAKFTAGFNAATRLIFAAKVGDICQPAIFNGLDMLRAQLLPLRLHLQWGPMHPTNYPNAKSNHSSGGLHFRLPEKRTRPGLRKRVSGDEKKKIDTQQKDERRDAIYQLFKHMCSGLVKGGKVQSETYTFVNDGQTKYENRKDAGCTGSPCAHLVGDSCDEAVSIRKHDRRGDRGQDIQGGVMGYWLRTYTHPSMNDFGTAITSPQTYFGKNPCRLAELRQNWFNSHVYTMSLSFNLPFDNIGIVLGMDTQADQINYNASLVAVDNAAPPSASSRPSAGGSTTPSSAQTIGPGAAVAYIWLCSLVSCRLVFSFTLEYNLGLYSAVTDNLWTR
ncbi:hypothetical protein C8R47DRAFT_1068676 [Mycena vitilis]|nr:hypothetical protein C8R47DRAFT_1068676 [Mycena vitilis]